MRRYLKLLTLCLIMIAMSFKGVAAASVALCDPVHDHASHGSAHAEHAHDHHEGPDAVRDGEELWHPATGTIGQPSSGVADPSACSTCGAHAVAGSPYEVAPAFLRASSIVIPFLSSIYVGTFADGLERPPKAIFA